MVPVPCEIAFSTHLKENAAMLCRHLTRATAPFRTPLARLSYFSGHPYETKIIDGERIAGELLQDVKGGVAAMKAKHGRVPGLAVVLVRTWRVFAIAAAVYVDVATLKSSRRVLTLVTHGGWRC